MHLQINKYPSVKERINYHSDYCGVDRHDLCENGASWWYNYPIQDFDYQFNSWGFRDEDFEKYTGKKVNICLGDSIAVNIGGPVEHSWPGQLKTYFDIPTLNFGLQSAGNDALYIIYNKLKEIFDIQNVFVMYGFFHRRLVDGEFTRNPYYDDQENFKYFLEHRITNVFECALPSWSYSKEEKQFLSELKIYYFDKPIDYLSNRELIDQDRKYCVNKDLYNNFRGTEWPTFKQFVQGAEPHPDMFTKEFGEFLSDEFLSDMYNRHKNRDGQHINQETNKIYADYFYNQWKQRNES